MYDFPFDKGVSIGEEAEDITVRNCLIHHVARGVQVKDVSTANIYNCTIVDAEIGLHCYEKIAGTGGGRLTNSYNNILWSVTNAFVIEIDSTIVVHHTDMQNTNWAGTGNFDADPLFLNAAGWDFRLEPGSPCLGTGLNGANVGARLPVGSIMAPSNPVIETLNQNASGVVVVFWADSERSYTLQSADRVTGGGWTKLANVFPQTLPRRVSIPDAPPAGAPRFYRLVSPAEP
jgi:hypothetical protein